MNLSGSSLHPSWSTLPGVGRFPGAQDIALSSDVDLQQLAMNLERYSGADVDA